LKCDAECHQALDFVHVVNKQRGIRIAQAVYDAQGNVVEVQTPRYFDSNDTNGNGKAHVTLAYTHRNLLKSRTEAAGVSGVEATESFTYYLDKRAKDHTDFRGNVWTTTWGACCGRVQAQIEPAAKVDGSGTDKRSAHVTRHDDYGDLPKSW